MAIVIRQIRTELRRLVFTEFTRMSRLRAIAVVLHGPIALFLPNALAIVVTVVTPTSFPPNLTQGPCIPLRAFAVLQIQWILPRLAVRCLETTIEMLPSGGSQLALSSILASQLTFGWYFGFFEFAMWPLESLQALTWLFVRVLNPCRLAVSAVHAKGNFGLIFLAKILSIANRKSMRKRRLLRHTRGEEKQE